MKKYVFINEQTKTWYIEEYTTINEAENNCPDGYSVDVYISTAQLP